MYILARVTFGRIISFVIHDTKQCVVAQATGGYEVGCPNRKDETKTNLDFGRVRNDLLQLWERNRFACNGGFDLVVNIRRYGDDAR